MENFPLHNVWLGVSVEDQTRAEERREDLRALAEAAWTTFASYEPALGPVDWTGWEFLRLLISGGENGPRPSHPDWHRAARDFCAVHDIAYFFKRWGSWVPIDDWPSEIVENLDVRDLAVEDMVKAGKARAGRLLDGREHNDMPGARV
jgi:protein gp37